MQWQARREVGKNQAAAALRIIFDDFAVHNRVHHIVYKNAFLERLRQGMVVNGKVTARDLHANLLDVHAGIYHSQSWREEQF